MLMLNNEAIRIDRFELDVAVAAAVISMLTERHEN